MWLFQVRLGDAGCAVRTTPEGDVVWKTTFSDGALSTCLSWTLRKLGLSSSVELLLAAADDAPSGEDTTEKSSEERLRSGAESEGDGEGP